MATSTSSSTPATITITDLTQNPDNYLYDVTFLNHHITTTVTADPTVVSSWLTSLTRPNHPRLVGLDIEWRPNFSKNSDNPAATLQLCTTCNDGNTLTCLIYQLLYGPNPLPKDLSDFLSVVDVNNAFVGVGIGTDVEKLIGDYGLSVGRVVDLGELAKQKGVVARRGVGLKELARVVMGVDVSKPKRVTMSRWDAEWLSYQQIQYAAVDAFLSFQIGTTLMAMGSNN